MKHIIVSDTHSPRCVEKALEYAKEVVGKIPQIDSIVINGDLLGIFSMTSSVRHKGQMITPEEMEEYLKSAAPKFYARLKEKGEITPAMVLQYVSERYQWALDTIAKFARVKRTIFNLGNHESDIHFLVLQEIPFLTGCDPSVIQNVDQEMLKKIYAGFESSLYQMEEMYNLKYIGDKPIVIDDTLIMGIPGKSHGTVGNDFASQVQEKKTQDIIEKAKPLLSQVSKIIIYNHTQGNYDRDTGRFSTASPSLKQFMGEIPDSVETKLYVQSHNHWNVTQFLFDEGFHFIMNNAGLHDGLFNMVDFDGPEVSCYDVDPINKKAIKMNLWSDFKPIQSENELIERNYPDPHPIIVRKSAHELLSLLNP